MTFSTNQAALALSVAPATMRKHRERKGYGTEALPGRTVWSMEEIEVLRREQGNHLPQFLVKFNVTQLKGDPLPGRVIIWGQSPTIAKSKATAWFWNAEVKAHPEKWGVPMKLIILSVKEQRK